MSKLKSPRHRLKTEKKRGKAERGQNSITGITVSVFISEIKKETTHCFDGSFFQKNPFPEM